MDMPGETVLKPSLVGAPRVFQVHGIGGAKATSTRSSDGSQDRLLGIFKTNDVWKNRGLPESFLGMNIHCISICHLWFSIESLHFSVPFWRVQDHRWMAMPLDISSRDRPYPSGGVSVSLTALKWTMGKFALPSGKQTQLLKMAIYSGFSHQKL